MTDPRITAALDRLDYASLTPFAINARLVSVLREVAELHYETGSEDGECSHCDACYEDWECATARAMAPLAELGVAPVFPSDEQKAGRLL